MIIVIVVVVLLVVMMAVTHLPVWSTAYGESATDFRRGRAYGDDVPTTIWWWWWWWRWRWR